jgi:predicted NodU family carbamoyl transferase
MVNSPRDALRTFFSSGLDALVMGNVLVTKRGR